MADTIPLMQMARQILQEYKYNPKDGEGLALLSSNALSMSEATLALHKYDKLFKMAEIGIALAILAENGKYLVNYLLGNWEHFSKYKPLFFKLCPLFQVIAPLLEYLDKNLPSTGVPKMRQFRILENIWKIIPYWLKKRILHIVI